ncbi:MAG TPA: winged helix-turn-helix domain-containing protein [Dyella sp.]|uniref:winged helix-turn-helix domain-containing protein n=1 Tax=Dyella sp. TaxID=1869338 RepID=UPI002CA2CBEA|nr:winged helix-turn-helix domain-containing protein [Dyella sp.]HUB92286.1 winged helix-turn-helix domain-containing protein [Dyella sp.]
MTGKGATVFRFGEFQLNPLARELSRHGEPVELAASAFDCLVYLIEHRERPVGKDELISAVWGRADVSDNLLAQTIVRLRRALGDAGMEQRCIKTVARVGYRWMLETQVLQQAAPDSVGAAASEQAMQTQAVAPSQPSSPPLLRRSLLAALLFTLLFAFVYAGWQWLGGRVAKAGFSFDRSAAIVLPVEVQAPDDWQWLHLGMMDMIANRLRDAKIPTESSQEALELIKDSGGDAGANLSSFALVVHSRAVLSGDGWHIHLDANAKDGRKWSAESTAGDVLAAVRAASDLLLAQLGYGGGMASPARGDAMEEFMQRVDATRLAGQPQLAKALLEKAPPAMRNDPELTYASASIDCDEGRTDACQQQLEALLQRLPEDRQPVLRGQVLTVLGQIYLGQHRNADSEAALAQAVHMLEDVRRAHGPKDVEALATAYLVRSYLHTQSWRLEEATSDLGRARVNYTLAGDLVGVAKADQAMGALALRRAQPDAAEILLRHAYDQFVGMGMRSMLPSILDALAYAQQMLLQFPDELRTTDRFWPLEEKSKDFGFIGDDMRHELTMVRAAALADNGRTAEASVLFRQVLDQTDAAKEPGLRAEVDKGLARLALDRGDYDHAAAFAADALTPTLQEDDQRDYAETWLMRISALQRAGKNDQAKHEIAAMLAWHAQLPIQNDWTNVYVLRAQAAQAWIDGEHDQALEQLKQALALADKLGVPDVIVSAGKAYALALLAAGHLDQAVAVSGRLSSWRQTDWRAAWVEARVYQALGQNDAWQKSHDMAQHLAGDRPLPAVSAAFEF